MPAKNEDEIMLSFADYPSLKDCEVGETLEVVGKSAEGLIVSKENYDMGPDQEGEDATPPEVQDNPVLERGMKFGVRGERMGMPT